LAIAEATAKAAGAKANQDAAQAHLTELMDGLRLIFHNSPDYLAAKANVDAAQSSYDDARQKAVSALHASDAYLSAVAARDPSTAAVDDARASGDGSAIADAAKGAMKARSAVSKMDQDALAQDQPFRDAKTELVASAAAVKALDTKLDVSLKVNADVQAASALSPFQMWVKRQRFTLNPLRDDALVKPITIRPSLDS
jgi:hypothetical protein